MRARIWQLDRLGFVGSSPSSDFLGGVGTIMPLEALFPPGGWCSRADVFLLSEGWAPGLEAPSTAPHVEWVCST